MGAWDEVQYALNERLREHLSNLPVSIRDRVQEMRLRAGQPVSLTIGSRSWLWNGTGLVSPSATCPGYRVTQCDLEDVLHRLSDGAIYSHEKQIRAGYIAMRNGHRAGLCGSFTADGHMYELTSINIRLARDVAGCAEPLFRRFGCTAVNALVVGAPGAGKTTLLRDLIRIYSCRGYRVGVADERCELCAGGAFDLGPCVDAISSMEKEKSIACLVRYMNPQIIALDELGDHFEAINACLLAGVRILTTFHADSLSQAKRRLSALRITEDVFDVLVVLDEDHIGQIKQMEWLHDMGEISGDPDDCVDPLRDRVV